MATPTEHYTNLLARHYTWMFGISFEEKVAEQQAILAQAFATANVTPKGLAVDLGSGPGFQSFALRDLGFTDILAVDSSEQLLAELESHRTSQPIRTVLSDIENLPSLTPPGKAAAIVCMGDTLTHLATKEAVTALIASAYSALAPGGVLILTWRDLSVDLTGLDRFIAVRSDETTLMNCFLDYDLPGTVLVHDLIHQLHPADPALNRAAYWTLDKSSYRKLRLSAEWLAETLTRAGFKVRPQSSAGRLLLLTATKF